ncbi:hypothetical protein EIP86_006198 [Pleurotus ostreatoroseus]|nr:hypothetical protein EIP86_006198 [Pleurotus ostreatoroseus]
MTTRKISITNTVRPARWKEVAPSPLPGPTFAAQSSLPRLPVPELSDTLTKLKESLKPIAWTDPEYQVVVRKIDEFGAKEGPELQKRLLARAQESGRLHWFEEWWDDLAYLGYRDSVVVNVSYYYGFDEHPSRLPQTALNRAAAIIRAGMIFRQWFKQGEVKPEATKEGPLCMDTWRWMFDCCRIPGQQGLDWSVSAAKEGDDGYSGHVIILRNGRVWKLDMWKDGVLMKLKDIEQQLKHIYDNTSHEYPGIGILTASNRDVWAKDYATLTSDPHNASIVEAIASSAFVVCLDKEEPATLVEHSRALWHGAVTHTSSKTVLGLRNRWVDKPVQFIVFDNGKAGIMGEHSVMDGTPTVALCDAVLDIIADPEFDKDTNPIAFPEPPTLAEPLDWRVSPEIERAVVTAEKAALDLIESQAMNIVRTPYGKAAIKSFGCSPDAWAQMIVQLAYDRLLKALGQRRQGGTYEAATTRKFLKGRTEAIRVVSAESDAWVQSMDDANASVEDKKSLFQTAVKKHGSWARMSGNGLGIDRHLLGSYQYLHWIGSVSWNVSTGLKLVKKPDERLPEMYNDPVYQRSSNWVLSTSAVFSKHFRPYGWGEVVPKGFGVAYMTGFDDYLQYTITSRADMPNEKFCEEIERAARDMYTLHSQVKDRKANL